MGGPLSVKPVAKKTFIPRFHKAQGHLGPAQTLVYEARTGIAFILYVFDLGSVKFQLSNISNTPQVYETSAM